MDFAYLGEFTLKDGSLTQRDLETKWADKDFVSQIALFTLVPKVDGWPLLRVHIPDKAKPVWTWRVFRQMARGGEGDAAAREMRIYGIGYKKRGQRPYMVWVVPGGHVEAGTADPLFAQTLWKQGM